MLGKLTKHEFIATARWFLPALVLVLVFGAVGSLSQLLNPRFQDLSASLLTVLYVGMIVAFFTLPTIMNVWRFHKNLLTSEGYLMFTLPVSTTSIIAAKLIVATVWQVMSLVVGLAATSLIALGAQGHVTSIWSSIIGSDPLIETILCVILIAFGLFGSTLMYYVSLAIGQLSTRHRVAATISAIAAIYVVTHVVAIGLMGLAASPEQTHLWPTVVLMVLYNVGYFFVARHLLTKKLNLV